MSNLNKSLNCFIFFTTITQGETLGPNENVKKNPREIPPSSYIAFLWLHAIKSMGNNRAF